jgi:uncharacterized pyridoxamine 5'-phosphate oxidase family protein
MVELTEDMRTRLANALADGCPVIAASIEPDGYPKLSFYGSAHVYSSDQLAIWHRKPDAGLMKRLDDHPKMAFMYRNPKDRAFFQFYGRARVSDDPEVRERVYANIPDVEKMFDQERKGVPVLIDVDRVVGFGIDQRREP